MLSSRDSCPLDAVQRTSSLTKSEAFGNKEVFEADNFGITTERVLLVEAILRNEKFVGETSDTPSRLTVGKDTRLELSRHILKDKEHNEINPRYTGEVINHQK